MALERLHQAVLGQDELRIGQELTAIREKHPELCESAAFKEANQLMRIHELARGLLSRPPELIAVQQLRRFKTLLSSYLSSELISR